MSYHNHFSVLDLDETECSGPYDSTRNRSSSGLIVISVNRTPILNTVNFGPDWQAKLRHSECVTWSQLSNHCSLQPQSQKPSKESAVRFLWLLWFWLSRGRWGTRALNITSPFLFCMLSCINRSSKLYFIPAPISTSHHNQHASSARKDGSNRSGFLRSHCTTRKAFIPSFLGVPYRNHPSTE